MVTNRCSFYPKVSEILFEIIYRKVQKLKNVYLAPKHKPLEGIKCVFGSELYAKKIKNGKALNQVNRKHSCLLKFIYLIPHDKVIEI